MLFVHGSAADHTTWSIQLASPLRERFTHDGYTVIEAPHSAEARRLAESATHIDLLVADVMMPGGSGPELYRALHPGRPEMRVLFISGYAERQLFNRAEIPPAAPFLAKPFTVEGLLRKVREVLTADVST